MMYLRHCPCNNTGPLLIRSPLRPVVHPVTLCIPVAGGTTGVNFTASMAGSEGAAADVADAGDDMAALEAEATEIVKKQVKLGAFVKAGGMGDGLY